MAIFVQILFKDFSILPSIFKHNPIKTLFAILTIWMGFISPKAQEILPIDLSEWRRNQQEILGKNPELYLENTQELKKRAIQLGDQRAELMALDANCTYSKVRNDFDQMLKYAKTLLTKAQEYKQITYEVMARKHLFEALIFSDLEEEAFNELQLGTKLAESLKEDQELDLLTLADIYIANSNYYSQQKDFQKQFEYIHIAGKYFKKIQNKSLKDRLLYIHHSNLAVVNYQLDREDSAVYFAELSLASEKNYDRDDIEFNNYSTIGNVAFKQENFEKALINFHLAEKITGYKNHLNTRLLYQNIIKSYERLNDTIAAKNYKNKLDSLELRITQSQKKSLQTLLKEEKTSNSSLQILHIIMAASLLVLIGIGLLFYRRFRKEKLNSNQEKSQSQINLSEEELNHLMEFLQNNDPTFLLYFDKKFGDFSSRLLAINPNLSSSELEICAMLKLKIPTKNMARYKYIAPKTVQNKKHLIRKKLNIPTNVDLYDWFNNF